ncbi:hypothetical protein V8E54_007893 [Elaphomyces granulatus]
MANKEKPMILCKYATGHQNPLGEDGSRREIEDLRRSHTEIEQGIIAESEDLGLRRRGAAAVSAENSAKRADNQLSKPATHGSSGTGSSGTSKFFRGQGAIGTSERKSYNTGKYTPIAVRFVAARKSGALALRARSTAEADIQGVDLGNGVYVKS